jgi:hypothetical protein
MGKATLSDAGRAEAPGFNGQTMRTIHRLHLGLRATLNPFCDWRTLAS